MTTLHGKLYILASAWTTDSFVTTYYSLIDRNRSVSFFLLSLSERNGLGDYHNEFFLRDSRWRRQTCTIGLRRNARCVYANGVLLQLTATGVSIRSMLFLLCPSVSQQNVCRLDTADLCHHPSTHSLAHSPIHLYIRPSFIPSSHARLFPPESTCTQADS
ncbi:hypothetical protein GQ42DRAFT_17675 [Ramicandelaber brevisporus]|nr:hypothetical protein GQ42DRAFT_17675 [Ramicandelaber brevisporus]